MMYKIKNVFNFLFILVPFALITGPAVPDLIITFGVIFGLFWIYFKNEGIYLISESFIQVSIYFWFSLILISFFAFNKEKSFQDSIIFIRFLLIPICCYFIFFKDKKIFEYLLFFVLILVVLVSIDTIYQFFNYTSVDGFGEDLLGFKSNWYGRLTGPFGDELIPGSYVSKFGLIGFVYLLINKFFYNKLYFHIFYLSMILIVSFLSGERMSVATFLLALFVLLIFLKNHRLTILISLILGLLVIFTIFKLHPFYNDYKILESNEYHQGLKIEKIFKCKDNQNETCSKIINIQPSFFEVVKNFDTSAYGEIFLLSYKMFKNSPITGIGISNFKYLCENNKNYKKEMVNYDCASHPHNIYIQWLTEGGLIVFIFFILYIFFIIRFIIKNNGDITNKVISLTLILILLWPIMSTGSLIKNWYGVCVFFIIGVCLCLSKLKKYY